MLIRLEPTTTTGEIVTGRIVGGRPVFSGFPMGTQLRVRILLSADGEDAPLPDVVGISLDLHASGEGVQMDGFVWSVDPAVYEFLTVGLPTPAAVSLRPVGTADHIVLDLDPVRVATLSITLQAAGVLDVIGLTSADLASSARLTAGTPATDFTVASGNLRGGVIEFEVQVPPAAADQDGDGVPDSTDAFPSDPGESLDTDGDGVGDNADAFPNDPNEQVDTDGDGTGDAADPDDDADGVADAEDAFPLDPTESSDADADGVGDLADAFPADPGETVDTDGDGIGNNADTDDDNDGTADEADAFPLDPNETTDSNGDGVGDNAETNQNMGPRVTGSLCGAISAILWIPLLSVWLCRTSRDRSAP